MRIPQTTWTRVDEVLSDLIDENGIKVSVQATAPTSTDFAAWMRANPVPTGIGTGAVALLIWRVLR